jgi:hypothetical protein
MSGGRSTGNLSAMKFAELRSIGHNIADSLASGISLLIGVPFTEDDIVKISATHRKWDWNEAP